MILTEEQKQRIVKDLTDFADIQYANNDKKERQKLGQFFTHTQQHLQPSILPWLSDYTHPWTDQMLYEYFELTPEQVGIIESKIV